MANIPQELMDRLHQATEQFTRARQVLEGVVDTPNVHKGTAGAALRAAEKELEDVTAEINKYLEPGEPAPDKGNPDAPGADERTSRRTE